MISIAKAARQADLFTRMVLASLCLHLLILIIAAIKVTFFSNEPIDWTQNAVRVDMVALPEKSQQFSEPVTEKETPKIKNKTVEKSIGSKKLSALDKIKKQVAEEERRNRLKDLAKEVADEERKERQNKVSEILKGNQLSKGSSTSGIGKIEFDEYRTKLHEQIKKNWTLPEWLQNDNLKAVVAVFIDFRGVVIKRYIEKSSGDPRFDEYALKAIDDSSPLPEPPSKLADRLRDEGIFLKFPY